MASLYNDLSDCGLRILAFPCNQFGSQEPGSNAEIKRFAESQGVKFDMMAKVQVNGPGTAEVWKYLKKKLPGDVKWNFDTHFIVSRNGTVLERFDGIMTPELVPKLRPLVCDDFGLKLRRASWRRKSRNKRKGAKGKRNRRKQLEKQEQEEE